MTDTERASRQDVLERLLEGFVDAKMVGDEIHVTAGHVALIITFEGDEIVVTQADGTAIAVIGYDADEVVEAVKNWR
jgi:hypothetical protein